MATTPHTPNPLIRLIDAAANRASEGLRVVEDYVRFTLDDRFLTEQWKSLRHDLTAALTEIPRLDRATARQTGHDVGTEITHPAEATRATLSDLFSANVARVQQSLRSLEEATKAVDPKIAAAIEALRYRSYTLAAAVEITHESFRRLHESRLCVLVDARSSPEDFESLVTSLVKAGVDLLQLRAPHCHDRTLMVRARTMRRLTRGSETLFVMNNRPDMAVAAHADGVHVGQEDLSVKDVRAVVPSGMLVGVSTHSIEQARQAVLDGANYLGVGPTFPSETKTFDTFPGLALLQQVATEIRLPAFAIGGVTDKRLDEVLGTGITSIAVCAGVIEADHPGEVITALRQRLDRR